MMNEGLSAGDILALTRDNDDNWQNNPFIYLVWLALLGGGNFLEAATMMLQCKVL